MQSQIFVFIGLPMAGSNANLEVLIDRLRKKFVESQYSVDFTQKGDLITMKYDGVSYYISILKDHSELADWFEMATNFELELNEEPVDKQTLVQRYIDSYDSKPDLYKKEHYTIGLMIMEEFEKFDQTAVYSFQ